MKKRQFKVPYWTKSDNKTKYLHVIARTSKEAREIAIRELTIRSDFKQVAGVRYIINLGLAE